MCRLKRPQDNQINNNFLSKLDAPVRPQTVGMDCLVFLKVVYTQNSFPAKYCEIRRLMSTQLTEDWTLNCSRGPKLSPGQSQTPLRPNNTLLFLANTKSKSVTNFENTFPMDKCTYKIKATGPFDLLKESVNSCRLTLRFDKMISWTSSYVFRCHHLFWATGSFGIIDILAATSKISKPS